MEIKDDVEKRRKKHLEDLRKPLTLEKYQVSFSYLNEEDKKEIKNWIDLSLNFYKKLKDDGYHTFEQRYPNPRLNQKLNLKEILDRDFRKINNIAETQKADQDIIEFANNFSKSEVAIRFKLFEYLIYCESILFLFEDIIRSISNKKYPYLVIGKLKTHILNNSNYKDYKKLFEPINENLRNAIGHSDYEIVNDSINYYYYNGFLGENQMSEISIRDFQNLLLKISILFNILLYQIDKPFVNEIESRYSSVLKP